MSAILVALAIAQAEFLPARQLSPNPTRHVFLGHERAPARDQAKYRKESWRHLFKDSQKCNIQRCNRSEIQGQQHSSLRRSRQQSVARVVHVRRDRDPDSDGFVPSK